MRDDVRGWLASERRIARPYAFASSPMAARASRDVKRRGMGNRFGASRQGGVIRGDFRPVFAVQPPGDGTHFGVLAAAVGIVVELSMQIPGIQPGKPRCQAAVALAPETVAGCAGMGGSAIAATERDDLTTAAKRRITAARAAPGQSKRRA